MTAPRTTCPGRILPRDRHYATAVRWTISTPAGLEIVTCGAACALDWLCKALPADVEAAAENSAGTAGEAA